MKRSKTPCARALTLEEVHKKKTCSLAPAPQRHIKLQRIPPRPLPGSESSLHCLFGHAIRTHTHTHTVPIHQRGVRLSSHNARVCAHPPIMAARMGWGPHDGTWIPAGMSAAAGCILTGNRAHLKRSQRDRFQITSFLGSWLCICCPLWSERGIEN